MAIEKSWTDSTGKVSFISAATIDQYELVKMVGNSTVKPTTAASDRAIGIALTQATATGKDVDVLLVNHGGTCPGVSSGAVTAGVKVYPFAGGLLKASATVAAAVPVGVCKNGCTITASRIEWIPLAAIKTT